MGSPTDGCRVRRVPERKSSPRTGRLSRGRCGTRESTSKGINEMAHDPFSEKAAENFLEGAATAAKWPKPGYVVEGTVLSYRMDHQKDYETSEPLYWEGKRRVIESLATDKSRPVTQMIMEIQGAPTGET